MGVMLPVNAEEKSLNSLLPAALPVGACCGETAKPGSAQPPTLPRCARGRAESAAEPPARASTEGALDRAASGLASAWSSGVIWAVQARRRSPLQGCREWVDQGLRAPVLLAALLPSAVDPLTALTALPPPRRGLRVRARARLSVGGAPCRLWIFALERPAAGEPEAFQLQWMGLLLEDAVRASRPAPGGPWLWPLHDGRASAAIMTASVRELDRLSWWRQALWALRLLPSRDGSEQERQLAKHYGVAVAYVFAWSNLYVRGLWLLVVPLVLLSNALDARPHELGSPQGLSWNLLQLYTVVWSMLLANAGLSRSRVLRDGGFSDVATVQEETPTASGGCRDQGPPPEPTRGSAKWPAARGLGAAPGRPVSDPRRGDAKRHDRGQLLQDRPHALSGCWDAAFVRPLQSLLLGCWLPVGAGRPYAREARGLTPEAAAARLQAAYRGHAARRAARLPEAGAAELTAHLALLLGRRQARRQDRWSASRAPRRTRPARRALVLLLSAAVVLLFVAACAAVLLAYVQLNVYITFVWGRCMEAEVRERAALEGRECRDPEYVHGIRGWLAEVSSDVSLAVVFDICLGEVSKLLAGFLVRLQDYELLYDQRHALVMLSLLIEALSKVGMFAVVGFLYLPQWQLHALDSVVAAEACRSLPDYQLCTVVFRCDLHADPDCCEGSLMCIARHFDFAHRKRLFERAAKGPFYVAPFVRILITVIVPYIVGWIEWAVAADARRVATKAEAKRRAPDAAAAPKRRAPLRCLRGSARALARILALIFHVDASSVGGLRYVFRGWPFSPPEPELELQRRRDGCHEEEEEEAGRLLERALDQAARRPFEPFDELVELKMNFLFVSFLAPVMPLGVVPTLAARLLEFRSKAVKLFFVRRRCWPAEGRLLHSTQRSFAHIAAHAAVVWHLGLVLVVYNSQVAQWGLVKTLALWMGSAVAVMALLHGMSRLLCLSCVPRKTRPPPA